MHIGRGSVVILNVILYSILTGWFLFASVGFPDYEIYGIYIGQSGEKYKTELLFSYLLKFINSIGGGASILYFMAWLSWSVSIYLILKRYNVYYFKTAFYFSLLNPGSLLLLQLPRYTLSSAVILLMVKTKIFRSIFILIISLSLHYISAILVAIRLAQHVTIRSIFKFNFSALILMLLFFSVIWVVLLPEFEKMNTLYDMYLDLGDKTNRLLFLAIISLMLIYLSKGSGIERNMEYLSLVFLILAAIYIPHASRFIMTLLPLYVAISSRYRHFGVNRYVYFSIIVASLVFSLVIVIFSLYSY